jgi:hypothetical protein
MMTPQLHVYEVEINHHHSPHAALRLLVEATSDGPVEEETDPPRARHRLLDEQQQQ